ncbi:hypothetical protein Lalb_Chr15g0085271 [Lupinus albus]|uniref:Uncharacterized protein n=1 Tax=Lupinus albus TaxID=3870 RepID=A0A6A4P9N3_LUPAL|nr:hypothetical protein Lalb_Chr15g0085271 [Lupinus albus]
MRNFLLLINYSLKLRNHKIFHHIGCQPKLQAVSPQVPLLICIQ